jgi:hypothetical protein
MKPSVTYASCGAEGWKLFRHIFTLIIFLMACSCAAKSENRIEKRAEDACKKHPVRPDGFVNGPCDTIFCTNGKIYKGYLVNVNNDAVLFWKYRRNSSKLKQVPLEKVFSIGNAVGSQRLIYIQDTTNEERFLSVDEMRYYIMGAKDARKYYHSPMSTIGGLFVGAASSLIGFWATPIPFLYTLYVHKASTRKAFCKMNERQAYTDIYNTVAGPPKKLNRKIGKQLKLERFTKMNFNIDPEFMDEYTRGFEDEANSKKAFNAAKGTAAGYVGILITSLIILL